MIKDKIKILVELSNPENWDLNYSRVARRLNLPISTVYDRVKKLREQEIFVLQVIPRIKLGEKK